MISDFIFKTVKEVFEHQLLKKQEILLKKLSTFVLNTNNEDEIFLMKGYAGTGKTSIIAALIKVFGKLEIKSLLLAPTGRAAKVLSFHSKKEAFTIHRKIYRQRASNSVFGKFDLNTNIRTNTFFIIDEASMISNQSYENNIFGSGRLLDDLIEHVYNDKNCKLILIGDTAQLPPVGLNISPALEKRELETYGKKVIEYELTEVIRQSKNSGILFNATNIRNIISENSRFFENTKLSKFPKLKIENFNDIKSVKGMDIVELISDAYSNYGEKNVAIICRSNKRANRYNMGIRNMVLYREEEISAGDLLMIVKNNYFWADDIDKIDFIANGDTAEILKIYNYEEKYGLRFADVTLNFPDYNTEIDLKIILDTLHSEAPALTQTKNQEFWDKVNDDFSEIKNKSKRYKKIRKNPFFNALQVKYAYAVTCHKAQGGQWKKVFVDQGWISKDRINVEYLRWLYTAFTRATEELYLVNFNKDFFDKNEEINYF